MLARIALPLLLLSWALVGLQACAARIEPIYNVENHPLPAAAQRLSLDDIGRDIIIAGTPRHWRFEPLGPGQMKATYDNGKHAATVKLTYTQKAYSITLVSTYNLLQEGDGVHRTYNHWVRNLEKDIEDRFQLVSLGAAR